MIVVATTADFRAKATAAVVYIVLFVMVYVALLLLALGILPACGYGAILLIAAKMMFATLALGIGLIAVGFFCLFFLIKFVFKRSKANYGDMIEIDADTQPELRDLIADLVVQTGTRFPKKIFLSAEVNASVFYNSSFWSMFLPVRKNLHIGLGLVNAVTVSELKGILAHEFGHFSQRSMKIGSYVYQSNKIIHDILFDNQSYERSVQKWASSSGYFALLIGIAIGFNKGVQLILQQMYKLVNKSHLALSREMEFHADAVAVQVVGSLPMERAMLRMDLIAESYSRTIGYYQHRAAESAKARNLFPQQQYVLDFVAREHQLQHVNGFPDVQIEFGNRFHKSRLVVKDQWSSHPATQDRVMAFRALDVAEIAPDHRPANQLFRNLDALQQQLTAKLFDHDDYRNNPEHTELDKFTSGFTTDYNAGRFPAVFNHYYDQHNPEPLDLDSGDDAIQNLDFDALFADHHLTRILERNGRRTDLAMLESLVAQPDGVKSFDYDGQRYAVTQAPQVIAAIRTQLEQDDVDIHAHDRVIFSSMMAMAARKQQLPQLRSAYSQLFDADTAYENRLDAYHGVLRDFAFTQETLPVDRIEAKLQDFRKAEQNFKAALTLLMTQDAFTRAWNETQIQRAHNYLDDRFAYFSRGNYHNDEIQILGLVLDDYVNGLGAHYFNLKKTLLETQAGLLQP